MAVYETGGRGVLLAMDRRHEIEVRGHVPVLGVNVLDVFGAETTAVARQMGFVVQTVSVEFVALGLVLGNVDHNYRADNGRRPETDWLRTN